MATITVDEPIAAAAAWTARRMRQNMRWAYRQARGPRRSGLVRHGSRDAAVGAALMTSPDTGITWTYEPRPSLQRAGV